VFVFTSDNGPLYDRLGGTDEEFFNSAGSLRGRKGSLYEGGVRVPLVVRWKGRVVAGATSDRVTGFEDWMPTLLELAGASSPAGIDGISFAPTLFGQPQPPRPFLYREFPSYGGYQSIRVGDWKAVRSGLLRTNLPAPIRTQLFDLSRDPTETEDVSALHADVLRNLENLMREQHSVSAQFPFPVLDQGR
jgi:arylsulfatase